ncbi:MAG TPA: hypothetical protein VLA43_07395, partial [Longimicrobiales bacterium]|nr:hypothetical protein [Longimicrobiales bacterium]
MIPPGDGLRGGLGRLMRLALLAYPREWRRERGWEVEEAFRAGIRRRREGRVPGSAAGYAARAVWDAVKAGLRERRRRGRER